MEKANELHPLILYFGWIFTFISLLLTAIFAYYAPDIIASFNNEKLISDNFYVNTAIQIYAGFLVSTVMLLCVHFFLWFLYIIGYMNDEEYIMCSDGIKPIRNFNAVVIAILFALLFLIAGLTVVRL